MKRYAILSPVLLLAAFALQAADAPPAPADRTKEDKKALSTIGAFVGGWRGVGIPDKSKSDGAWGEEAQWAWEFKDGRAAIVFDATDAQIYKSGRITPGDKAGAFALTATLPDGKASESFTGAVDKEGTLVFEADKDHGKDRPAQITLRTVARGNRLLILYSKKLGSNYARIAEVGYTRKGSNFASKSTANECVVTGGEGDIKVEYQGKSYYVCCKGCLDEFKENPAKVMAEYKQRKEEEAKKKKE